MDTAIPYLRSQDSLYAEAKILMRDPTPERWTVVEYYTALNQVLMTWAGMVKIGFVYTVPAGWESNTFDYTLPSYIRPPIFPEMLRSSPYYDYAPVTASSLWQDVQGWELVPNSTGGQSLRLYAHPRNQEGQVHFYAPNSRVPVTIPTTSGSTAAAATTMLLGSAVDVDDVGIIKCEAEYISYNGLTRTATTTTLNNLVHALNGSTAAVHATGSSVYWCVAMDDMRLNKLLFDQWRSCMHAYFIQDGGVHESARHEKGMGYYDQMAVNFWAQYKPVRRTSDLTFNRKAFMFR